MIISVYNNDREWEDMLSKSVRENHQVLANMPIVEAAPGHLSFTKNEYEPW